MPLSIDVGCGFTEGVQFPADADISLDLNMGKAKPSFFKKLKNPIAADALNLPIRSEVADIVYWRAVLEHLPDPETAITEGRRVLRYKGEARIVLPMITSHMKHYLTILFTQFPFSIPEIIHCLWRARLYWHIPGVPHIRDVKPWHLRAYFDDTSWKPHPYRHKWFYAWWGRFFRWILNGREPIRDIQGQYCVRCVK